MALPPEPHPTVLAFATNVVPKYAEAFAERWAAHRQFVHEYANERGLARENLGAQQRQSAATDFLKAIGIQEG